MKPIHWNSVKPIESYLDFGCSIKIMDYNCSGNFIYFSIAFICDNKVTLYKEYMVLDTDTSTIYVRPFDMEKDDYKPTKHENYIHYETKDDLIIRIYKDKTIDSISMENPIFEYVIDNKETIISVLKEIYAESILK